MPFDPNTAVDITPQKTGFDPTTAVDIPTPNINVYDNKSKNTMSVPGAFDEDRTRYVKATQIDKELISDFWGMSETKNSILSQMARGFAGFAYQLPSTLRSVYKAAVELQTAQLKKLPEIMSDFDRVTYGLMTGQPMESVYVKGFKPDAARTVITNEKTVAKINELNEANKKYMEKSKLAKTVADGFFYDLTSGIGSLGTAVALTAITRSPASAAILFGGIQKGSSYEELRAKGYSPEYADKVSNITGVAEASLEFVGLDLFMKSIKGNKIIGRFIKGAITEGLQEASQTTAEELVMQKFGGREKEISETLGDIAYSGLLGMIIGAPTSAVLGTVSKAAQKKGITKKQSDAIVNKVLTHDEIEGQAHKLFDNEIDPLTFPNADENLAVKGLDESLTEIETRKAEEAKGIKETIKTEILEAGVDEGEAEQVSDIMQARAEAAGATLGVSPQEWLEAKKLQIKGEQPEADFYEAIQEETLIEDIEQPTEILQQPARGQIEFGPDNTIIRLFQGKDRSTLLHETGHLFLRDMDAIATETQDEQTTADMATIRQWLKVKEGETLTREQEEQFADGFVSYINTGKAPNAKLVSAFERFKQWLLSMYEKVKTRVTLTPEVREIFDRMLGGYDVKTATNIKAEYGDRLAELQALSENIKAGRLADITQAQLDELESLINAAKQRGPAAPQSLFQWIRRRGGIWDKGGELRDMDLPAGIIRTKADSYLPTQALYNALDTVREAAVTEGFLDEDADINDLINLISQEAKGEKKYRKQDLDQLERRESVLKDKDDAEMILSQLEINPEEILQIIRKNRAKQLKAVPTPEFAGVLSRIERLERAVGRIATDQKKLTPAQIKAITKADIKEIQARVIDLIKSARLDPKDRAKFIAAIKNIQTGEQLAKILPSLQERIARYRETTQKANIRKQIRKELKTIKPKVISGKLKGKFDAETQEALQTFKDIEKMTVEKARENLQKVWDLSRKMQYKPNELELMQHQWMQMQAYYASASQKEMQQVLDFIRQLKSEARIKLFERLEQEKERRQALIDRVIKAIPGLKTFDVKSITDEKKKKYISNWMNVYAHDWNSLINKIITDKELSEEFFSKNVEDAEHELKRLWLQYDKTRNNMLMEAYNIPETQIIKVLSSLKDTVKFENLTGSDGVVRNHTIQRGQLIELYALAKNEMIYEDLTNPDKNAFSEMGLKTMFSYLTESDMKFANLLMKYFNEVGHPALNEAVKRRNGINLPQIKVYYPTAREGKHTEEENIISQVIYQTSMTPSATKQRKGSKEPLRIRNVLDTWEKYEEEKNTYIAMGDVVTDINSIFRDRTLRATVNGKIGGNAIQAVEAHLKTLGLEAQKEVKTGWVKARGTFSGLKTAIATVVFVKQLTSLMAYLEILTKKQFTAGTTSYFLHPVDNAKKLYKSSVFLQERWKRRSMDRDLKALNNLSLTKKVAVWNTAMTSFVRVGDIMPILIGMHSMMKAGYSLREAERFSSRTQQSADASKMSLAQKGNETQRTFTIFKSTPLQFLRKIFIATRDVIRGDITHRQAAKIYAIYGIILPALYSAAGMAWRPDKDWKEFFNTLITANVGGVVLVGDAFKLLSSSILGVKYYPPSIPFWNEFEDVVKNSSKLLNGEVDKVDWEDMLTSIIELATLPTGVMLPAKRGWNAAEGLYEVFDGKNRTKGLLKLGGYTDYRAKKITE